MIRMLAASKGEKHYWVLRQLLRAEMVRLNLALPDRKQAPANRAVTE
jgi:hypothetical protein